jgi:hypothetical protein
LGFWYWKRCWDFDRYPKLHFLGSSHGILVAKGHDVWNPVDQLTVHGGVSHHGIPGIHLYVRFCLHHHGNIL